MLVGHDVHWRFQIQLLNPSKADWQRKFNTLELPIQADLVQTVIIKVVELHELSNIVNWSLNWFGSVRELQHPKERLSETISQLLT
jgi:hypothetical protein